MIIKDKTLPCGHHTEFKALGCQHPMDEPCKICKCCGICREDIYYNSDDLCMDCTEKGKK
jgi:hypothetical protein